MVRLVRRSAAGSRGSRSPLGSRGCAAAGSALNAALNAEMSGPLKRAVARAAREHLPDTSKIHVLLARGKLRSPAAVIRASQARARPAPSVSAVGGGTTPFMHAQFAGAVQELVAVSVRRGARRGTRRSPRQLPRWLQRRGAGMS